MNVVSEFASGRTVGVEWQRQVPLAGRTLRLGSHGESTVRAGPRDTALGDFIRALVLNDGKQLNTMNMHFTHIRSTEQMVSKSDIASCFIQYTRL